MKFWIMIIVGECSSGDDSVFDDDYMQLVIPGTHGFNDSDSDEQRIATHVDEKFIGLGGVSLKFVQQDISTIFAEWETFVV
jgi:hypothetical protein